MERIELGNQHLRIVAVTIPCEIPKRLFNVESTQMRGRVPIDNEPVPNMRRGVLGNFCLTKGPFSVKFNDGTTLFS